MEKIFNKKQCLQFRMKPFSFKDMGEKLIRVTCYLLETGINRNGSNITKEAVIKANEKLAHLPVVGHLMQDQYGDWYLGGHDYEIDVQPEVEMKPLTVPLGCIAGDTPFEFVELLEENTGKKREYLKCDMIIWNHMSPVMKAAYDEDIYFNHSIEISEVDGDWDDTNNFRIDSFEYDRACLLGLDSNKWSVKHTEPCFVKSQVLPKQYEEANDFNKSFALLMHEINRFNLESQTTSNLNINNYLKKEEKVLAENKQFNVQLDQEKVKTKLVTAVSENKYRNKSDKHCSKYEFLSMTDSTVTVIDREDSYKIYSLPYMATAIENDISIAIDFEKKEEKSFVIGDKVETELFNIQNEVEVASTDAAAYGVSNYHSETLENYKKEIDAITENFDNAVAEIERLTGQLEIFEKEKKELIASKHKERVDDLLANYERVVPKCTELTQYAMNVDYKKSYEVIENDVIKIYDDYKFKTESNTKKSYQALETEVVNSTWLKSKSSNNRYGTYFDE